MKKKQPTYHARNFQEVMGGHALHLCIVPERLVPYFRTHSSTATGTCCRKFLPGWPGLRGDANKILVEEGLAFAEMAPVCCVWILLEGFRMSIRSSCRVLDPNRSSHDDRQKEGKKEGRREGRKKERKTESGADFCPNRDLMLHGECLQAFWF